MRKIAVFAGSGALRGLRPRKTHIAPTRLAVSGMIPVTLSRSRYMWRIPVTLAFAVSDDEHVTDIGDVDRVRTAAAFA